MTLYVPENQNLWRPGLSAHLEGVGQSAQWQVPRTGTYALLASPGLADHPWFQNPLLYFVFRGPSDSEFLLDPAKGGPSPPELDWTLDGAPLRITGITTLRQGSRLQVQSRSTLPMGLFLLPSDLPARFQGSPGGRTLDTNLFGLWNTE